MKNVRRIILHAINSIATVHDEFSCNALNRAEEEINNTELTINSQVEKLYREIFSYNFKPVAGDAFLNAVEEAGNHEEEEIKNVRIFMLSLFLVAYKDFI